MPLPNELSSHQPLKSHFFQWLPLLWLCKTFGFSDSCCITLCNSLKLNFTDFDMSFYFQFKNTYLGLGKMDGSVGISSFFNFFFIFYFMHMSFVCLYVYVSHVCLMPENVRWGCGSPGAGVELKTVVSHMWVLEIEPGFSTRAKWSSLLKRWLSS